MTWCHAELWAVQVCSGWMSGLVCCLAQGLASLLRVCCIAWCSKRNRFSVDCFDQRLVWLGLFDNHFVEDVGVLGCLGIPLVTFEGAWVLIKVIPKLSWVVHRVRRSHPCFEKGWKGWRKPDGYFKRFHFNLVLWIFFDHFVLRPTTECSSHVSFQGPSKRFWRGVCLRQNAVSHVHFSH